MHICFSFRKLNFVRFKALPFKIYQLIAIQIILPLISCHSHGSWNYKHSWIYYRPWTVAFHLVDTFFFGRCSSSSHLYVEVLIERQRICWPSENRTERPLQWNCWNSSSMVWMKFIMPYFIAFLILCLRGQQVVQLNY